MLNKKYISLSFAALLAGAACGKTADRDTNNVANNNPTGDCQVGDVTGSFDGKVDGDTTFCGVVDLTGELYNSADATITIRPGTIFNVPVDEKITLGWAGNTPTIVAVGTADAPIVFRGTTAVAGHWQGIKVSSQATSNSRFEHVVVQHAGGQDAAAFAIETDSGVTLKNFSVSESAGVGIEARAFSASSENVSVVDSEGPAYSLTGSAAVTTFPMGGEYTGNTKNYVAVDFDGMDADTHFQDGGLSYMLNEGLYNSEDIELIADAGVEFIVGVDQEIILGWAGKPMTVSFNGTAEGPIVFKGSIEEAGHWHGIDISQNVSTASSLTFVEIMHGGGGDKAALDLDSPILVNDLKFANNLNASLRVSDDGFKAGSSNLTIEDTEGASAEVAADALFSLPLGGSFGSGDAYVDIVDGGYGKSGQIPLLDVPYRVSDSLYNSADSELEIETGVTLVFAADKNLISGWAGHTLTIKADGVNFVGALGTPGAWTGLDIQGNTATGSYIKNSTISHAGEIAVRIDKASGFEFSGNTVVQTTGYCIEKRNDDAYDYIANNTLDCSGGPIAP